jgi:asparagine synthase (glutamine-hydrolysing)
MGFAFRRLSILDLAGGHQPMGNEDGSVQVIFNGEIYNYRELAAELRSRGHRFRTASDTEVLVHLYEEQGARLVEQLRGMFAFAIWDARQKRLLLARDRLGIKPLFYRAQPGEVLFASEIKGILAMLPPSARELDPESLVRYLCFLYLPGERSIFRGIRKLPPAHLLECGEGGVTLKRYWTLPEADPSPSFDRDEAVERLRALLEESVRLRLISDVPLGAFLSGGVDSSCVVALMRRVSPDPVRSFSIGFDEPGFDETPVARSVARALGTDHHEETVRPDAVSLVEAVVDSFDEPFGDPSAIPTHLVSQLARTRVTVALSGDGGDELFAGYHRYRGLRRLARLRVLPGTWRRAAARALDRPGSLLQARAASALRRSLLEFPEDYLGSVNFLSDSRAAAALRAHWKAEAGRVGWEIPTGRWLDPVDGAQRIDLHHYLPEDILAKVDRMSMACSLEARVPLLDHKVVEFVSALPPAWKRGGGRPKSLLLDAAGRDLPPAVWQRRKHGFGIPLARWFRAELRGYARDILLGETARRRDWWDPEGVSRVLDAHETGRWDYSELIWGFLTLEIWHRRYLDAASGDAALGAAGGPALRVAGGAGRRAGS